MGLLSHSCYSICEDGLTNSWWYSLCFRAKKSSSKKTPATAAADAEGQR